VKVAILIFFASISRLSLMEVARTPELSGVQPRRAREVALVPDSEWLDAGVGAEPAAEDFGVWACPVE
jgi:hypothetical protein